MSTVILQIPELEQCVSVPMQRVDIVTGVKPATVVVYSYYEPSKSCFLTRHVTLLIFT